MGEVIEVTLAGLYLLPLHKSVIQCYMENASFNFGEFYSTPLGQAAGHQIQACIREAWPDLTGQSLLGLGYAMPYLDFYLEPAAPVFAFMPFQRQEVTWPDRGLSRVAFTQNDILPLSDQSIDHVLMVHALEHADQTRLFLREVWRVLTGNGRLLVVVPNRRSLWAHLETTPFGYGKPYTMTQLIHTLDDNLFTPVSYRRALYMFPGHSSWAMASKSLFETCGPKILQKFSGIVCVEAVKQVYRGTAVPLKNRLPVPALVKCRV